jgi:hypothetical protein
MGGFKQINCILARAHIMTETAKVLADLPDAVRRRIKCGFIFGPVLVLADGVKLNVLDHCFVKHIQVAQKGGGA